MLGELCLQLGRQLLSLDQLRVRQLQYLLQRQPDPRMVNCRIEVRQALISLPLRVVGVVRVQALGEGAQQHRHAQKWTGDLHQREPLGVVTRS